MRRVNEEISRAHEASAVVVGDKTVVTWELDYWQISALVDSGVEIIIGEKESKVDS